MVLVSLQVLVSVACSPAGTTAASSAGSDDAMQVPMFMGPIMPLQQASPGDPRKIALGKLLFNDSRLSGDNTIACSTCHVLRDGGDDGLPVSIGIGGRKGQVNTPTVFNSGLNPSQFWDGRARTLEEQIAMTVESPSEMGGNWSDIERELGGDAAMARRFSTIFPDGLTTQNAIVALAEYVRALVTPNAPLDLYLKGNINALDDEQRRGFDLFKNFGCVSCHQGRNIGGNLYQRFGVMGDYFAERGNVKRSDYGRYNVTGREEDRYKFKVPSLRNVAETAPYFHDGSAKTLEDAVKIMSQYQLGRPISDEQVHLLVSFLQSLSGDVDESLL